MPDQAISDLYTANPIITPDPNDMVEIGGVASGAIKFSDLTAAVLVVLGNLGNTDNAILRTNGTGGISAQGSLVTIDDSGSIAAKSIDVSPGVDGTIILRAIDGYGTLKFQFGQLAVPRFYVSSDVIIGSPDTSGISFHQSSGILSLRFGDDSNYANFHAAIFTGSPAGLAGSGSEITGVPGTFTIDTGWQQNNDVGNKAVAITVQSSNAAAIAFIVNALDPTGTNGVGNYFSNYINNGIEKVKALQTAGVVLLAPNI